jgi:putative ABC transport system permease protein
MRCHSLSNLSAHKMRSALAMLGVVFGVGAVIAMLSIGAGAEKEALAMIQRLGMDNILVRARTYDNEQLEEVRETSIGVSARSRSHCRRRSRSGGDRAQGRDRSREVPATATAEATVGASPRRTCVYRRRLREGRFIDVIDLREHAQVRNIGLSARDLFSAGAAAGRRSRSTTSG